MIVKFIIFSNIFNHIMVRTIIFKLAKYPEAVLFIKIHCFLIVTLNATPKYSSFYT